MKSEGINERCVYLFVGQRGSGKSHYAERLAAAAKPKEFFKVSRDEILVRLFGTTDTDTYFGGQWYALEIMDRYLRRLLKTRQSVKILLDCWTENSQDRSLLIKKLRDYGATRVVALYFITPSDLVNVWFWRKPGIAKMSEMSLRKDQGLMFFGENAPFQDYGVFHELARDIDSDGFDEVIRIDPLQELIDLS